MVRNHLRPLLLAGGLASAALAAACVQAGQPAPSSAVAVDAPAASVSPAMQDATPVLAADALFTSPVAGLENTKATREEVAVTGQPFNKALRVKLAEAGKETNATQVMVPISAPVAQGDALMATFFVRGAATSGNAPANVILMFEQATDPWTKSVTQRVSAPATPGAWRRVVVPFTAAGDYQPGQAMLSLRLATQAQTVEIGGLSVVNFRKRLGRDELLDRAAKANPLGKVTVAVDFNKPRQTMQGIGGNFAKGRFGMTEMNDGAGRYTLDNLNTTHARIGIPLQFWIDEPGGKYKDEGPVHGAFLLMQEMAKRKIPMVASAWDAPKWMIADPSKENQRVIPRDKWPAAIDALAEWLVVARDKYGATPDYLSFNEADGGYQIKFTTDEIRDFMKMAAPKFAARGLKTKWLVGDTSNGRALVAYTRPLLEDKELAPLLGPISFHSWDALSVDDKDYQAIAALGREFNKPVWCLELGYDPQLWRVQPPVWDTWDNGMKLAEAYWKTVALAEASVLDYWEYQEDYPLVDGAKQKPFPAFFAVKHFTEALPPGTVVVETRSTSDGLRTLAARDPKTGRVSALLLNTSGEGEATLTGLPAGKSMTLTRTTRTERMRPVSGRFTVGKDGRLTVPVAPRSVTTLLQKM